MITLSIAAAETPDFVRDVHPILEAHCLKCHGPEEQNGSLRYDQKAAVLGPADSGKRAVVPGKPDQSELLKRITSTHKDEQMPPKGSRLGATEIEIFRQWIASGAQWPESASLLLKRNPQALIGLSSRFVSTPCLK
ncbi:MAG: c-type cytochrome domain-containing protein [Verrucomicrobiota bacterium]